MESKNALNFAFVAIVLVGMVALVACNNAEAGKAGYGKFSSIPASSSTFFKPSCKIISTVSSDYQWIWDEKPTASAVCKKEGMSCRGVFQEKRMSYLDDAEKVQAVESEYHALSPHYCKERLGDTHRGSEFNSVSDYAEPYSGGVSIDELYYGVLCCG